MPKKNDHPGVGPTDNRTVMVPSSKSLTQRAILIAALSSGRSLVVNPLDCDDSRVLRKALGKMGVQVEYTTTGDGTSGVSALEITGPEQLRPPGETLFLNNAGTAVRFLAPISVLLRAGESITIDGVEAMRNRPMKGLLDTLGRMGVEIECLEKPFCPPVLLKKRRSDPVPHVVKLDPAGSSQQLSGLLMIGPKMESGLKIQLTSSLPSSPYVDLTVDVMECFGITVQKSVGKEGKKEDVFSVPAGGYTAAKYFVEGDHSSASYMLAASALTGKPVHVANVSPKSRQGDRFFAEILEELKPPGPKEIDMHECPDVAPTALVFALFRNDPTSIVNVSHLKLKECNRIEVPAKELSKLGANIKTREDGWDIHPAPLSGPAELDPHEDHRMAMIFGILSLKVDGITILNPGCVDKSFPDFWEKLELFK